MNDTLPSPIAIHLTGYIRSWRLGLEASPIRMDRRGQVRSRRVEEDLETGLTVFGDLEVTDIFGTRRFCWTGFHPMAIDFNVNTAKGQ